MLSISVVVVFPYPFEREVEHRRRAPVDGQLDVVLVEVRQIETADEALEQQPEVVVPIAGGRNQLRLNCLIKEWMIGVFNQYFSDALSERTKFSVCAAWW